MKKWVLSRHDSIEAAQKVEEALGVKLDLTHSSQGRCEEPEDGVVFLHFDDRLAFVQWDGRTVPFLGSPETLALFPSATVDEGAIKFLLNGADVMRPGVRAFDQWGQAGKLVVVKEEKKGRAIAVGEATVESGAMAAMSKGVCFRNLHHVGDRFWNLYKTL
jgi:predicted RNA-binding protein (TIGR00451 family)